MTLRTFSHGGGVQSTAALVLSAQGKIDFPVHLFCNVGDDSEHPATLAYVRDYSIPYAAEHGIEFITLHKTNRGKPETLYGRLTKEGSKSLPIPVRMSNGAPGTRSCTMDFKLRLIARWLKQHGATEEQPATTGIGFSTDEMERVGRGKNRPYEIVSYPLIELGLNRSNCLQIVKDAGLPQPPKSACWFCPMHRPSKWSEMRRDEPELFERACQLEELLNRRRDALPCPKGGTVASREVWVRDEEGGPVYRSEPVGPGQPIVCCGNDLVTDDEGRVPVHGKDHVWFTRFNRPLRDIGEAQATLDFDGWGESCDEGTCFV